MDQFPAEPTAMRVLYIDDDRINTILFEQTCRMSTPWQVCSAACGSEALDMAHQFEPQLLVIDLHLPDTNGYALLAALRELPGLGQAPAFLCSADPPQLVGAAAAEAGFNGVWEKPVNVPAMLADVSRHCSPMPTQTAAQTAARTAA